MIRNLITLTLLLATVTVFGQNYGTKIDPAVGFSKRLKSASASTQSIACDFDQTKHMSVLAKAVDSKGRFYYKREQNICLEYTHPEGNAIVMSSGKFKMVNGGRATVVDSKANPMMRQLSGMLTACMTGNIEMFGKEAATEYYESPSCYTVVITPTNRRVKNYLKRIILSFDKQDMTLSTLRMCESDSDYTIYEFRSKRLNGAIPEEKFKI